MKKLFFTLLASALCASAVAQNSSIEFVATPDTASKSVNYNSNRAPLAPAAFIKLPLGAITPEGWVGEMLKRQGDGLAGHLGEISAWLVKKGNAWLEKEGHAGWEEVPYWLRGYADMAFILKDEKMKAETMVWIEAILAPQRHENGRTFVTIENIERWDYVLITSSWE